MSRTVAIALACLLSSAAQAACPAATPVDTARWIYEKHQDFYLKDKGGADYLSKSLLSLLKKDWACQNGDQCAVSANPWTDAQDGDVQKPIDWKLVSNSDKQAVVEMTYNLGYKDAPQQPVSSQTTRLLMAKNANSCWVLDNLQGPQGVALGQALEEFPYEGD
ncbi:hypothetical protein N018_10720 [Pseudomonas syringae CC1557]|uniref:Uncharacterized protein n=1 Tax=Pseudomonas syringae CC1557 TaxID=1357279 RepID=W0MUH0_PSESX|nr:DUF3828 domain-containing protein [Pseudomonas syringae]AHG40693.1 hypothetical protein N018_10720 [Pseudomonas syringae CC1557]